MEPARGSDVYLNVYDLVEQNNYMHWAGVGIYHSGVEIYGVEYAFGGHEYDAPGVFATHPRLAPGTVALREALLVGYTTLTPTEVYDLVQNMGHEYKGNKYHLLQMNCNTFSTDLCRRLTGTEPPSWVNRLANIAVSLHCLLPPGWVPPLRPPTGVINAEHLPSREGDDERTVLLGPSPGPSLNLSSGGGISGSSAGGGSNNNNNIKQERSNGGAG
ncbi:hypothetical protein Ndes2526B_g08857 [Nannochloris sp. 'desiccata']|nr:hypothetical protein KSW81_001577 [Chlorella desiccata (nom. nud.)]KAH7616757.1 putative DeSI-like protein [Chlorella desiccata (nom. nud.)]